MKILIKLLILLSLLLSALGQADEKTHPDLVYSVQSGESIWSIAHDILNDWKDWKAIADINQIINDRQMPPGTELIIPYEMISERQSTAKVIDVNGTVTARVAMKDGNLKAQLPLVRGQRLKRDDIITTGNQSSALLEFDDGTRILILENSLLHIKRTRIIGNSRKILDIKIFIEKGEAEIRANPSKVPGSHFLIETPIAFATTKGTTYRVRNQTGYSTIIEVTQGKVGVKNTEGETEVNKGQGTLVRAGMSPTKPEALLKPPILSGLKSVIHYLPYELTWQPVKGATKYRVQLVSGTDFNLVFYDQIIAKSNTVIPDTLQDRQYQLKVSAISNNGIQGFSQTNLINIAAHPLPPIKQSPRSDELLYTGDIKFKWLQPEDTASFMLEISNEPDFNRPIIKQKITQTNFSLNMPKQGQYFWRVTSITSTGKTGPKGQADKFTLNPLPGTPSIQNIKPQDETVFLNWSDAPHATSYQLQLAEDKSFQQLLINQSTNRSELVIKKLNPSKYFIRVRGIDANGKAGNWCATQEINQQNESWWSLILFGGTAAIIFLL